MKTYVAVLFVVCTTLAYLLGQATLQMHYNDPQEVLNETK